ncbi:MAG: phosphopyruvate hydratase [Legionellaceae bacterium]|nr:phosphopyruvate hydratase [Legionellaceae bacterium]
MHITRIISRYILDSRGNPTVEADVHLKGGAWGRASVPSGASTGSREACELRDNHPAIFHGKGVSHAIHAIETRIQPALIGHSVEQQAQIDATLCALDGTRNKSQLGANAILAVSLACARAYAAATEQPLFQALSQPSVAMSLPMPMMNIINGGAHANNQLAIQEFMIIPLGADRFETALRMGAEVFQTLKKILHSRKQSTAVGDEGGFAPSLPSNRHALDLLLEAIEKTGYTPGKEIGIALDVAASELLQKDGQYMIDYAHPSMGLDELIHYYDTLIQNYPILSIEDPLGESDNLGWEMLTRALGSKVQIVGDDIFVTQRPYLQEGIAQGRANAILIKPNQVGTLTETRDTMAFAAQHDYATIVSHRSGETEDTFIADLAVASGCGQIKTGSLCRSDRVAKYNQLLRIEEMSTLPFAAFPRRDFPCV